MGCQIWALVVTLAWVATMSSANGGIGGWRRWLALNGGVDGWRRCWAGVFDTEGTVVRVTRTALACFSSELYARSSPLMVDDAHWTPPRFFKAATWSESSGDELGILEDDRCIDTGVFQRRYLVHELVFA